MILLTSAYDPGSKDPGVSYTHVNVLDVHHDFEHKVMVLRWQYGHLNEGAFIPGKEPPEVASLRGDNYTAFVNALSTINPNAASAYKKALHKAIVYIGRHEGTVE